MVVFADSSTAVLNLKLEVITSLEQLNFFIFQLLKLPGNHLFIPNSLFPHILFMLLYLCWNACILSYCVSFISWRKCNRNGSHPGVVISFPMQPLSPYRNWPLRPAAHRALQHPRLHRLPVPGPVQRRRPPQVGVEKLRAGPGLADDRPAGPNACVSPTGFLPGQAGRVQLRGIASHHPTNVCRNGPLASGQHRSGGNCTVLVAFATERTIGG